MSWSAVLIASIRPVIILGLGIEENAESDDLLDGVPLEFVAEVLLEPWQVVTFQTVADGEVLASGVDVVGA